MMTAQQKYERRRLVDHMSGFVMNESEAWRFQSARWGPISKCQLIALGQVVADVLQLDLVREYKRRKSTMVKWFDEYWDVIRPFIEKRVQIFTD